MLRLDGAGFRVSPRGKWILEALQLEFAPGQFWGLIGPNGSGKSTLLRLLSGEWSPTCGEVLLSGRSLAQLSPAALARRRAVLSQKSALRFPFSVEEVVHFGLYSQQSAPQSSPPSFAMEPIQAMKATEVDGHAQRLYPTLSGGEACRVDLARVLAQKTPILLLDEPTNHLDPRFQVAILGLCQKLAEAGALVIAALHDLNLAARFCHQLVMLKQGQLVATGAPKQVLSSQQLVEVYGIPFEIFYDSQARPFVVPAPSNQAERSHP